MGKKQNNKAKTSETRSGKSGKRNAWLIVGSAAVMICIAWATLRLTHSESAQLENSKPAATLIATLSPDQYTGKARAAYQAAKDIPEVLVELPCFCGCVDNLGHRNNLYCFADSHGSICDLCQDIALSAQEMHRKGMSTDQIRDNIQATYGSAQ